MKYLKEFDKQEELITSFGKSKAYLIWTMGLYLDFPDLYQLAAESLVDGSNDKKNDFVRLDIDNQKLVIVQGTYSDKNVYKASSNKAADLNTAISWLFSGEVSKLPDPLKAITQAIREALDKQEIDTIELLYVHNMGESQNVTEELTTTKNQCQKIFEGKDIEVIAKELGLENIEKLFSIKMAGIMIRDNVTLPEVEKFREEGTEWTASIFTVTGTWLSEIYSRYSDDLFSANYRNFLGISNRGRKKINKGIKETAEERPTDFWAFNNGITILTSKYRKDPSDSTKTILQGITIINGAQTTGSIHAAPKEQLEKVKILCRVIEATNPETINSIIEFNNTQNEITTWDKFSKTESQQRINEEFKKLGYTYSFKRGFGNNSQLSIEVVAQPVSAFHGFFIEAGSGKNKIFETPNLRSDAFENNIKSKHILLAYCLSRAVDKKTLELKRKNDEGKCTTDDEKILLLLRNLKFKYFLIAVIGDSMEEILNQKTEKRMVCFANGVANSEQNTIDELIEKCENIVFLIMKFTQNSINELNYTKDFYEKTVRDVKNSIASSRMSAPQPFEKFAEIISPTG